MAVILNNIARAVLSAPLTTSTTTVLLQTGEGARFPAPSGGDWFPLALEDAESNIELCRATARNGDSITVVRGQDGTQARAFSAGAACELRMTVAALLAFIQQNMPESTGGGGAGTIDPSQLLQRINNLSDVPDKTEARGNLGVYSKAEVDDAIDTASAGGVIDLASYMKKSDNLSDVSDVATARSNISVYSKAEIDNLINTGGGSTSEPAPFVPGNINSIGAYRSFTKEVLLGSGPLPLVGITIEGASVGTTGTWRIHGVVDQGSIDYGLEGGSVLYQRYTLICLRVS